MRKLCRKLNSKLKHVLLSTTINQNNRFSIDVELSELHSAATYVGLLSIAIQRSSVATYRSSLAVIFECNVIVKMAAPYFNENYVVLI